MNKLAQVIKKEFRDVTRGKAFIILTLLGPLLILAVSVLPSMLAQKTIEDGQKNQVIGLYCTDKTEAAVLVGAFDNAGIKLVEGTDVTEMKQSVPKGDLDGVLVINGSLYNDSSATFSSKSKTNVVLFETIKAILKSVRSGMKTTETVNILSAAGIENPKALLEDFNKDIEFTVFELNEQNQETAVSDSALTDMIFVGLGFMMMIYMTALLYGQMIGRTVVIEKTSKTVEVLLSSISPSQMMFGKIFGIALAGLLQYAVWATVGIALITFAGPALGISLPQGLSVINIVYLVVFFVLAFFLYGTLYAALGAASEDEQNLGQMAWPLIILLMIPMITFMQFLSNPNGILSVTLSLIPFTAPEVMLMRLLVSEVPLVQIISCLVILVVTIVLVGLFAAKIFRIGILMTGKKFKLGEVLAWITKKD